MAVSPPPLPPNSPNHTNMPPPLIPLQTSGFPVEDPRLPSRPMFIESTLINNRWVHNSSQIISPPTYIIFPANIDAQTRIIMLTVPGTMQIHLYVEAESECETSMDLFIWETSNVASNPNSIENSKSFCRIVNLPYGGMVKPEQSVVQRMLIFSLPSLAKMGLTLI